MELKDIFNIGSTVAEAKHHKQKHHHKKGEMVKNSHTNSVGMVLSPFLRGYWPIAVLGGGHEHWRDDRCVPHTPGPADTPAAANPVPADPAPADLGPANGDGAPSGDVGAVAEGRQMKNHMDETEYSTWDSWRKACRKAYDGVTFEGDKDIAQAMWKEGRAVGEWDGSVGVVYKKPAGLAEAAKLTSADAEKNGNVWVVSFTHCPGAKDTRDFTIRVVKAISSAQAVATAKAKLPKDIQDCAKVASVKMTGKVVEGRAMNDIAVGGTVIYKSIHDKCYKISKVRKKNDSNLTISTVSGDTVQTLAIVSTDASDWSMYKEKSLKEAFGIRIDGELWMKGDKPVMFASQEEADAAILKSPSMSLKNAKVVPLNESPELQALGKGLKGTVGTKATVAADSTVDDAEVKTDVNTPPADKAALDAADDEASPSEFKVGDKVKPTVGPHKDVVHSVIHVFPDGRINLKPDGLKTDQIKYRLGAVTAQPDQVALAESRKFTGSLLAQFSLMEAGRSNDDFMPLSYKPGKGHKIEAYGRKGMKNTKWRKFFKDGDAMSKWCEDNDATVEGSRDLEADETRK